MAVTAKTNTKPVSYKCKRACVINRLMPDGYNVPFYVAKGKVLSDVPVASRKYFDVVE